MAQIPQHADKIAFELYEAAARKAARHKSRNYLGMSEIGKACDLALWLNFRDFSKLPLDGRAVMLFGFGDMIEAQVIEWLNAAGYRVEGRQDAFTAHNGLFCGHCDGVIHGVTKKAHILEVKSANSKRFAAFKKAGVLATAPVYYAQAQCYMGYAGLERALFVIQCKDNSEIYTERVYFDRETFNALHARAGRIIEDNEPPEGIKEGSFDCQWCDYRLSCRDMKGHVQLASDKACGNCHYLWFWNGGEPGARPWCFHPEHPYQIQRWGESCPDYIYQCDLSGLSLQKLTVQQMEDSQGVQKTQRQLSCIH
jgi:hypothetical protein